MKFIMEGKIHEVKAYYRKTVVQIERRIRIKLPQHHKPRTFFVGGFVERDPADPVVEVKTITVHLGERA